MATIDDVIDRALRRYLYPAFDQPIMSRLSADINDGDTVITVEAFDGLEFSDAVTEGTIIEMGFEWMRVVDAADVADESGPLTLTVVRGLYGTTSVLPHSAGDTVIVAPQFARYDMWKAAKEEVEALYPDLWVTRDIDLSSLPWYLPDDFSDIIAAVYVSVDGTEWPMHNARVAQRGGAAVLTDHNEQAIAQYPVRLTYAARTVPPNTPTDSLDSLNCEDRWEDLIALGVAIQMTAGQNVSDLRADYLTEVTETQVTEAVGPADLEQALRRSRGYRMQEERRRIRATQRTWTQMRSAQGI